MRLQVTNLFKILVGSLYIFTKIYTATKIPFLVGFVALLIPHSNQFVYILTGLTYLILCIFTYENTPTLMRNLSIIKWSSFDDDIKSWQFRILLIICVIFGFGSFEPPSNIAFLIAVVVSIFISIIFFIRKSDFDQNKGPIPEAMSYVNYKRRIICAFLAIVVLWAPILFFIVAFSIFWFLSFYLSQIFIFVVILWVLGSIYGILRVKQGRYGNVLRLLKLGFDPLQSVVYSLTESTESILGEDCSDEAKVKRMTLSMTIMLNLFALFPLSLIIVDSCSSLIAGFSLFELYILPTNPLFKLLCYWGFIFISVMLLYFLYFWLIFALRSRNFILTWSKRRLGKNIHNIHVPSLPYGGLKLYVLNLVFCLLIILLGSPDRTADFLTYILYVGTFAKIVFFISLFFMIIDLACILISIKRKKVETDSRNIYKDNINIPIAASSTWLVVSLGWIMHYENTFLDLFLVLLLTPAIVCLFYGPDIFYPDIKYPELKNKIVGTKRKCKEFLEKLKHKANNYLKVLSGKNR